MSLAIAEQFVARFNKKDFDGALSLMSDDITMDSPMGKKVGKEKVKGMLKVIKNMSRRPLEVPQEEDGTIFTVGHTLLGKARVVFGFQGELITEMKAER